MQTEAPEVTNFKSSPPPILVWDGQESWQKPRYEVRYFHRRRVEVWNGYVRTKSVVGWVQNVRIDLFVEKWMRDHKTPPTNEDILEWMVSDPNHEFHLETLADSILKNGVRQKIVITSEGTLLDGNRRYFAALMSLRKAEKSNDKDAIQIVSSLPAYVLSPGCQKADLDAVLVEENFVDDCRIPWPNYIKAKRVYETYKELRENHTKPQAVGELTAQFGIPKAHVERFLKMMDYIQEFQDHHSQEDEETGKKAKDDFDIRWRVQEYFEYFDELTKTQVLNTLINDHDLRDKVFERLYDGDFASFVQIRKLPAIAADRVARDKFMTLDGGPKAVESAIAWVTAAGIARKAMANDERIIGFKNFLQTLTALEISSLNREAVADLQVIAEMVTNMTNATHKDR
jgi:hypothetical protein